MFPRNGYTCNGEAGCYVSGVLRGVMKRRELGQPVQLSSAREAEKRWCYSWVDNWQESWTGDCGKRTWTCEVEESPLLVAIAREWLVKTQQAGKGLASAVVRICEVWKLSIAFWMLVVLSGVYKWSINPCPIYSNTSRDNIVATLL
jgi:hypothetical protein